MENFADFIDSATSTILGISVIVVAILICIVSVVSICVSIFLTVKYIRFNHTKNSAGLSGKEVARKILDDNGLKNIKVKCSGSVLWGNSYSHYFHKVRLRRLTWKKKSVSSLAMAAQKSSLAILDKEDDPDMRRRVKLVPIITFGPFAFIPLIIVGVILDIIFFDTIGITSLICTVAGLLFYIYSFVLSIKVLKTEKKAQERAYDILKDNGMATESELEDMKELFKLYNIEYVNDMILAMLELIYRILQILINAKNNSNKSRD